MCTPGIAAAGPPDGAPDAPRPLPDARVYNAKQLGEILRVLRDDRGVTQAELADRLGIPRRYLSTLEQGHATEQLERLLALLDELGAHIVIRRPAR